ncbi:MAG: DUF1326 domain-containing protein [Candidatus Poribacteria bacterium]
MKRVTVTTTLALCFLLALTIGASYAETPWKLSGVHVEPCCCEIPCKHVTGEADTPCKGSDIFHVDKGFYGDIALDNLDFAVVGEWSLEAFPVGLYVSEKASPEQFNAIQSIAEEVFGLPMVLGAKSVPFNFEMSGDTWKLSIPDILEIESVLLPDMPSVPGYFGTPFLQAQAVVQKYNDSDFDIKWGELNGLNSWHSKLSLESEGLATAVSPQSKLASTWGDIKQR